MYCLGTCNILVTLLHKVKCISMLLQELTPLVCDTVSYSCPIGSVNEQTCSANWGQGHCLWLTGDMNIRLFSDGRQQAPITAASSIICMWGHIYLCHVANSWPCAKSVADWSSVGLHFNFFCEAVTRLVECQNATVVINRKLEQNNLGLLRNCIFS